uniref:Serine/threonine-protein kinase ATR n=1 Tax=Strongyloides venezuelensis TaxID=75913 RepID=A0A0K0F940_STRVS
MDICSFIPKTADDERVSGLIIDVYNMYIALTKSVNKNPNLRLGNEDLKKVVITWEALFSYKYVVDTVYNDSNIIDIGLRHLIELVTISDEIVPLEFFEWIGAILFRTYCYVPSGHLIAKLIEDYAPQVCSLHNKDTEYEYLRRIKTILYGIHEGESIVTLFEVNENVNSLLTKVEVNVRRAQREVHLKRILVLVLANADFMFEKPSHFEVLHQLVVPVMDIMTLKNEPIETTSLCLRFLSLVLSSIDPLYSISGHIYSHIFKILQTVDCNFLDGGYSPKSTYKEILNYACCVLTYLSTCLRKTPQKYGPTLHELTLFSKLGRKVISHVKLCRIGHKLIISMMGDICMFLTNAPTLPTHIDDSSISKFKICVGELIECIFANEKDIPKNVILALFNFYISTNSDVEIESFLSKLCGQSKTVLKNIKNQNAILSFIMACQTSDYIKNQFVPDEKKFKEIVGYICNESPNEESFEELFRYIAEFIPLYTSNRRALMVTLLQPWFDIKSLFNGELLKTYPSSIFNSYSFIKSVKLKALSIPCIVKLQLDNTLRRSIYHYSLTDAADGIQQVALEYAPIFVSQCGTSIFGSISSDIMCKMLDPGSLSNKSKLKLLITSLSEILCSLDKNNVFESNKIVCSACTKNERSKCITSMELTDKFVTCFIEILENENNDDEVMIKLASLLTSIFKHVSIRTDYFHKIAKGFFKMLGYYRSENCNPMNVCLQEVVSRDIPKEILSTLRTSLDSLNPENHYPYLNIISTTISEGPFLLSCISRMISLAADFYFHGDRTVVDMSKKIIVVNAKKAGITTETLLKRYSHAVIPLITQTILDRLTPTPSRPEIPTDSEKGNLINSYFRQLADIFNISPKKNSRDRILDTVKETIKYVVARLLFVDKTQKNSSRYVLNHFSKYVIRESLPQLISRSINVAFEFFFTESERRDEALSYIEELTGKEITSIVFEKRSSLKLTFLQNLGRNKATCLQHLSTLFWNDRNNPFSLTKIIEENVMGIFAGFRMSILEEERYYHRRNDLQSLAVMINIMDEEFVNKVSNKLLTLLRSLSVFGEIAIAPWYNFMEKLSVHKKIELLPKILTSVAMLLKFPSSTNIINNFLQLRLKESLGVKEKERFDRVFSIIYSCGLKNHIDKLNSDFMHKYEAMLEVECTPKATITNYAKVLYEEGSEIVEITLKRLDSLLDGSVLEDQLSQELIPAILYAIRCNNSKNIRRLACLVLGKIGAIDPGRLRNRFKDTDELTYGKSIEYDNFMVDTPQKFLVELLENLCQLLLGCINAKDTDNISYAIQKILKEVIDGTNDGLNVWKNLSDSCKIELKPFTNCGLYTTKKKIGDNMIPVVSNLVTGSYHLWSKAFYSVLSENLKDPVVGKALSAASFVIHIDNPEFFFYLFKNIMIQAFIEENNKIIEICKNEFYEIFKRSVADSGWVRVATQTIFSLFDELTLFAYKKKKEQETKNFPDRILKFIYNDIYSFKYDNKRLVINAAEACQCWFRALKLTEYFEQGDVSELSQEFYHNIGKISMKLDDFDNTLGCYECIEENFIPTTEETILALEASRNYTEALALYGQSESSPVPMIDCLLKIDQPNLAFSQIASILKSYTLTEDEKKKLEERRIVTLWKLSYWDQLDNSIDQNGEIQFESWEASSAAIFNAIHKNNETLFNKAINDCYEKVEVELSAVILQNRESYEQAYRYIQKLHMLFEISDSRRFLFVDANESMIKQDKKFASVLNKWKKRADKCIQGGGALEPILANRREVLKMISNNDSKKAIGCEYLHSAQLARFENNLNSVWSFMTHAKHYPVNLVKIAMEEAAYFVKKNNYSEAIKILDRSLRKTYRKLNRLYGLDENGYSRDNIMDTDEEFTDEDKNIYLKARLHEIDYRIAAGVGDFKEIYGMFRKLISLTPPPQQAEKLWYKWAVFMDNYHSTRSKQGCDLNSVRKTICAYISVLESGNNYAHHALPRLLTLWLDYTHKYHELLELNNVKILNEIVTYAFNEKINPAVSYKAIQQIFSRLAHPDAAVFDALKSLVITLIEKFPHQCLWHTMGIYRMALKSDNHEIRTTRMKDIIEQACEQLKFKHDFKYTVKGYDYFSRELMNIGNKNTKYDKIKTIEIPKLKAFFHNSKLTNSSGSRTFCQKLPNPPKIILPMSFLLDDPIPAPSFNSFTLTQNINNDEIQSSSTTINDVYIYDVDEDVVILQSLMRPKRLTLIGSDGKRYPILCKDSDELRKDLRAMEFNKRVNSLLIRNPEARRRHLRIRTYTVIPLQEEGGIIEWVPNLITLKGALCSEFDDKDGDSNSKFNDTFKKWSRLNSTQDKIKYMTQQLYHIFPKVLGEYYRKQFVDPGQWYNARLNYTRSSATMCMVGFILGLGDRHCENILLDQKSGEIIHVDYNILFNKGELLKIPEIVPFRLTRNIIDGFGPCSVEGHFRTSCELSLSTMRDNKEMLLTLLHSFIHDPLLEWRSVEKRTQQSRNEQNFGGLPMKTDQAPIDAKNAILHIDRRLSGFIVTPFFFKDQHSNYPMSVNGQVNKLINIAKDNENLAKMYVGWAPYL